MTNTYNTIFPYLLSITTILGLYLAYRYRQTILRAATFVLVLATLSAFGWAISREPEIRVENKIIEVPKAKESLNDLLNEIPLAYGVSRLVVETIINRESGRDPKAIRFEAHHMARASKFSKNSDQQRMYASSHGLMQVMAWHMPPLGLSWTDLYDQRTNVETGTKILKDCLIRHKAVKSKWQQYHRALECYNGSSKYADLVMSDVGRMLVEGVL